MTDDANATPVALHEFSCASCGKEAGLAQLFGPADSGRIIRRSFTSLFTYPVAADEFERVREIILAGDAARLHEFNLEVASFYCPECRAYYCGEHWAHWDVFDDDDGFFWHDSIRGRCPLGHERMLED